MHSHLFLTNILILLALLSWTVGIPAGGFTPSALFNSASNSGWAINSTTFANGWNTLQSWSGDPVNLATGNLYHTERDISVLGRGLPLVFEHNYNSRGTAANNGPLGYGWTHR